jgi:Tol biopolymer transport system component
MALFERAWKGLDYPEVSADGRLVVSVQVSSGRDRARRTDVVAHDRLESRLTSLPLGRTRPSGAPAISADGQAIVFEWLASDLE